MTPTIIAALTGFFVYTGIGGIPTTTTAESLLQTKAPQAPTYQSYSVSMTAYNAVPGQTDEDPTTTASGAFSNPDIIAARSVDLADELPFGTVIMITTASTTPNCGIGLVEDQIGLRVIGDSMHSRMRNKIDILFDEKDTVRARGRQMNPALVFGHCKNVQIQIVGKVDIKRIPKTQAELAAAVGLAKLASK